MDFKLIKKMKRILVILVALMGFGFGANAQNIIIQQNNTQSGNNNTPDPNKRYISVSLRNSRNHDSYSMTLSKEGTFSYSYYGQNRSASTEKGTYYLDANNKLHLFYENGFSEICTLSYYGNRNLCQISDCSKFGGSIYQYD